MSDTLPLSPAQRVSNAELRARLEAKRKGGDYSAWLNYALQLELVRAWTNGLKYAKRGLVWFVLGQMACAAAGGAVIAITIKTGLSERAANQPIELSQQERASGALIWHTTPLVAEIHFVSKEEFERIRPKGAIAFAHTNSAPCKIFIPAGDGILFFPEARRASWTSIDTDNTIAHELLHCWRGRWHK